MSDFKAKMHQIGFLLGPEPAGGPYRAPPDLLAVLRGLLLRGRRGKGRVREGRVGHPQLGSLEPPVPAFYALKVDTLVLTSSYV